MTLTPNSNPGQMLGSFLCQSPRRHTVHVHVFCTVLWWGSGTSFTCPLQQRSPSVLPGNSITDIRMANLLNAAIPMLVFGCLEPAATITSTPHPLKVTGSQILGGTDHTLLYTLNSSWLETNGNKSVRKSEWCFNPGKLFQNTAKYNIAVINMKAFWALVYIKS